MGDFVIIRSDNFVTIANTFLKDKNLSNKAKGVLAMILALPPTWDFSIKGMVAITKDGESSLRAAINEMKENGYCAMKPVRINNKIARWKYLFSGEKLSEKLLCDFLQVENLNVENQAQYNNILNDGSSINTPTLKENKNKRLSNDNQKIEYSDDFLNFWALYGYPKDKRTAYSRWRHLNKESKELAVKAIPAYFEDCARNRRSKQHPATYLNKRTFEDDFSVQGKIAFYDIQPTDSDKEKQYKDWMRKNYPDIENTALPLSYADFVVLRQDYGQEDLLNAIDVMYRDIYRYRKADIAQVLKSYLADEEE